MAENNIQRCCRGIYGTPQRGCLNVVDMASGSGDTMRTKMKSKSYGDVVICSFNNLRQNDELCDFTVAAQGKSIRTSLQSTDGSVFWIRHLDMALIESWDHFSRAYRDLKQNWHDFKGQGGWAESVLCCIYVQVHKILLAATSDYFKAMLLGSMQESKEDFVDLKGLTAESLEQLMDFLYSGEMELDFDNLIEILNGASHLQVQAALDLCSDYMISRLTFANADELLPIADTYSLTRVTTFYSNKVLQNFEDFSRTEQFLALSANQLSRYLADDNLQVRSERVLFDCLGRWYEHDQSRHENLDSLLKCVRFSIMSEMELAQLQQHRLTRQYLPSMGYIMDGIKYHNDSKMGHPWLNPGTRLRCKDKSLALVHQGSSHRPFEITAFNHHDGSYYQLVTDSSGSRDCRITAVDNFVFICRVVDCGGGTLMNSLLRFDPRHLVLQELTPCRHLRIDPALTAKDQWLYIFGGTDEHYTILDSVECYDVRSNRWLEMLSLPVPTHSHSATVNKGVIYLSGGVSGQDRQPTSSLICFDSTNHRWETKTNMHCARRLHEMTSLEDKLYVVGGIGTHSFHQQTQIPIESYHIASNQWTLLTVSTLAGRSIGHFLTFQNQVLSIGREHYEATEDELWRYDPETDVWKQYTKVPHRAGLSSASCVLLYINFFDEKIAKRIITAKR